MNKITALSVAAMVALLAAGAAHAQTFTFSDPTFTTLSGIETGTTADIYNNDGGVSATGEMSYIASNSPTYTYINAVDSFQWSNNASSATNAFLKLDGVGVTDTADVGDTIISNTGFIDVTAADVLAESAGTYYSFTATASDDEVDLFANGTQILTTNVFGTSTQGPITVDFTSPGYYSFEDLYYNGYGGAIQNLTTSDPLGATVTYVTQTPEPSTVAMMALGGLGLLVFVARRRTANI